MSGEAKTSKFLLADATVMVGPRADVFELTPALHSLGLAKRVQANAEPQWAELTQGISKQVVFSVNTGINSTVSAEIYEYTARNLAYGAGIDASGVSYDEFTTTFALASQLTDASSTIPLATGAGASFTVGDFLVLQKDESDLVCVIKVGSVATDTITPAAGYGLPTGVTWPVATTRVFRVRNPLKVGTQNDDGLLGVKIVGVMPDNQRPMTLIFPKARIQKGLNVAFQEEDFANMMFEFKPYALLPADTFYADFAGNKSWMVLPA